ncbi:MLP1_9 [Sanghuangporus weigelae]
MPPRRRSKKNPEADADNASARSTPPPTGSFTIGPLLQDIDLQALSNLFPDAHLETPSAVLVVQCYRLILNQAQQLDEKERIIEAQEAEAERKEIELDQALQDRENLLAELDVNVKDVQNELTKVKAEKEEIATSRDALKADLERISSSESSSSHEVADLKKKIEEVEKEKRNLLGVVSRLQEDVAERDQEINNLRESLKVARKEAQELESTSRDIRASERSTAFKVETLTHQLQLVKDENERANAELTKKTEEYSTYRRDKHTELVQLQAELDAVKQSYNQTLTNLRTLQTSHNKQTQQLSQSLQKVQDLQNQLADQEAKYSSEAANLRRLIQMLEERENHAKELVAGIEKDWEGLGQKAAENEQKLREALEAEQQRTKELEEELEELRSVLDRISSGELPVPSGAQASPNVSADSLFNFSPNISMINRMQKSGKTFTEVYAEYVRMQGELAKKQRDMENLDRTLGGVLAELEEATPALAHQKQEIERVQAESDQLATQLSRALAERDASLVELQNAKKVEENLKGENALQKRQLDDLGLQIKGLLKELGRLQDATLPSDEDLQVIQPASNVEEVITNNLVLYKSIPELQQKNMALLGLIREISSRMENAEQEYKARMENEQNEAIREAHEAIMTLQAQLESTQASHQATIQAYIKERDTLKTMISRYERGGALPAATSTQQASPSSPQVNGSVREPTELEKELEEVRTNFEAYRKEMGVDTIKLREEVLQYQRESSQLGAALAKANARIEFLNERHRMAQEQYIMHEREAQNLQKRNQQLHDQYTRLDIACSHAAEELASANTQIERLRNECSNLRAEKKIWENVQTRLIDENKVLSLERSRMADLIANVQKMHNDIDKANGSDRQRFESQIHNLEAQAQDLRTQLSRERDTVRQISLQKDIEVQELRTKVDRSVENLSKARESLVEAETSRKHLQERVDELVKQVQMNEEKIAVYERRTSSATGTTGDTSRPPAGEDGSEQELKVEVAELRAALKAAEVDLAAARSHVQQFQEISQASEAALQSLSATHDEYKASTEAEIAKVEAERKALEEKVSSLQDEMTRLNTKNGELQQTLEKEREAYAQDKKMLEDTIVDITNIEMSSRTDQTSRENEIREQMERAKAAEEKYSREIVAHAESIKVVDAFKKELTETRASLREKMVQAETAQANLTSSEASWNQQREVLNKEIADLTARCKDLAAQNSLLHQHLESVSSQASRIRQAADSNMNVPESGDGDDVDSRVVELRSVVAYLRKEKEIVDLQLELSKQENARQKAQIDHLSQALEETRTALSNEREEAAKAISNSAEHAELLERINQLNILRESNATLRAECEAQARKARQLETTLNHLQSELNPLKEEATTLRAELDAKNAQIQRLEDESRQWKERNAQLLTKYDRIDPNDVQALKDEIEDLQIDLRKAEEEKAAYTAEKDAQTKLLEDTQATLADFRTKYSSLGQESRNRLGQLNHQISKLNETVAELRKQVKDLSDEKERLASQAAAATSSDSNAEVESLKTQLAAAAQEKETSAKLLANEMSKVAKAAADHEAALSALREERDKLLAEKASLTAATEKLRTELQDPGVDTAEIATRHAEELRVLEARLTAKHEEELKAAIERTRKEAKEEATKAGAVAPLGTTQDTISKEEHEQALKAATERGRMESTTKLKLKDGMLQKAQANVKHLEAQIKAWREAGVVPAAPTIPPGSVATPVKATPPVPVKPAPSAASSAAAGHATAATRPTAKTTPGTATAPAPIAGPSTPTSATPAALPKKPMLGVAIAATGDAHARGGRGGGAVRGVRGARGVARGGTVRGGAPAAIAQAAAANAADGGVSIIGAATKRAREETTENTAESLAKRIKPAETTAAAKPVALRRDRIATTPNPVPPS